MSYEDKNGGRQRHMSVSNYASNAIHDPHTIDRRRSSVVPAGSISGATQGANVLNQRDETFRKMSVAVPNLVELSQDAKEAAHKERTMGFIEGCKLYPLAMFFSFGLSLAVVMEGYDTWLLGSFYGIPAFAEKYGHPHSIVDGVQTYQVSPDWQTALSNGTAAAQIIGLFINGILSERIGYRKMMMGSLVFIACCIFITFFAVDIHMLLAGYVLSGLPW
jgi:MFS transporter, SP family, general alpha glucoside:H+ symporter